MSGLATRERMSAERFLSDIANHKLTIRMDNGIYRHLEFRQAKNSWNLWFGIVTWPGFLTICGDMGAWTFSRVEDMFTFFRDEKLRINADYWAEKLQHGQFGGRDGAKQFNEDLFRGQLLEQLTDYHSLEGIDLATVTQALQNEVLTQDGKYDLMIAARDFTCRLPDGEKFQFDTCELPDGKEYSYHFLWCLYAIVWGIQQYDAVYAVAEI